MNYELTLEHILDKLYREGLANYTDKIFDNSGLPDTMHAQLKLASEDKIELVKSMAEEIKEEGAKPVDECTYLFPSTDVKAFVEVAVAVEGTYTRRFLHEAFLSNACHGTPMSSTYIFDMTLFIPLSLVKILALLMDI